MRNDDVPFVAWVIGCCVVAVVGIGALLLAEPTSDRRPAPEYDVDRVVKMHEENRKCAAELEEAQDAVRICGRLLKGALE